jgi:stalled ribosome rescue protein Dom34
MGETFSLLEGFITMHYHIVVWIDHRAAHIFPFNHNEADHTIIRHHDAAQRIHRKAGPRGSGHVHEDKAYLSEVAEAMRPAGEILITGPSLAKTELKTYLDKNEPSIAAKVLGVEPLDQMGDEEVLAFARKYFTRADRMTPQR